MRFSPHPQRELLGLALLVMATAALTAGAIVTPYFPVDLALGQAIQSVQAPGLEEAAGALHQVGRPVAAAIEIAGLAALLFAMGRRWSALLVMTLLVPNALNQGLKALIGRPRPDDALVSVLVDSGSSAFPSGHMVHFTLLFGLLWYLFAGSRLPRGARMAVALLMVLGLVAVGVSRVYLGAHWPSDVLGGFLWGALYLWLLLAAYRWWRRAGARPR